MRLLLLFWLLLFHAVVEGIGVSGGKSIVVTVGASMATTPELFRFDDDSDNRNNDEPNRIPARKRTWRPVHSIFDEMGPCCQQCACRMPAPSFWKLLQLLKPHMTCASIKPKSGSKKRNQRNGASNGVIPKSIRLSCALRHFAGGLVDDAAKHVTASGLLWTQSTSAPSLPLNFQQNTNNKRVVAKQFEETSKAQFNCCVGDIDRMLVWTEKPALKECEKAKCGQIKFCCGRKKKFGLNLQGVCDAFGRFLNANVKHPGSTGDCLAFMASPLKNKQESKVLLNNECICFLLRGCVCLVTTLASTLNAWQPCIRMSKLAPRMATFFVTQAFESK